MVLSSQTPRAGMSRMYMSSRPKSRVRWGWIIAIGVCLALMFVIWQDDNNSQAEGEAGSPATANAAGPTLQPDATNDGGGSANTPRSVSELPAPSNLDSPSTANPRRTREPVVQTITFGEARNNAATASPPTNTVQPTGNPPAHRDSQTTSSQGGARLSSGMTMIREGRLVQGRRELSQLLLNDNGSLSDLDAQAVRETLTSINKHLVFSSEVVAGDPLAESYLVQRGDYLSRIAPKYGIPYQFIERINNTPAERLQAGKPIKLIKGPFHARISKRNFRMDIFLTDTDGTELYIRSFSVGLGKDDSTPMGKFIVDSTKVENPSWRNPRTGEFFAKNDPKNPIGEYWLGLDGADPTTESLDGYGIHGTIDPSSIGRQASMGCVRLSDDDIALIYDMLEPNKSTVEITW